MHGLGAGGAAFEALAHFLAAGDERGFQRIGNMLTVRLGAALGDGVELRRKGTAIDDFALTRDFSHYCRSYREAAKLSRLCCSAAGNWVRFAILKISRTFQ